jgi:hypothetical protein
VWRGTSCSILSRRVANGAAVASLEGFLVSRKLGLRMLEKPPAKSANDGLSGGVELTENLNL